MKFLRRFCAVIIGITFLVSGLSKIIDPVGTMLIVTEYLKLLHLGFLIPGAKVLGVVLSTLEAVTGLALITGVLRKIAAWVSFVLVGFFTIVTLFLLVKNPDMDCGCFGEAFHLSHLQSFLKNIGLVALSLVAFLPLGKLGSPRPRKWVSFGIAVLSVLYAVLYSNTHIPVLDFTEFAPGTELMASLDDDIEADNHYEPAFIYEKNGQRGSFPLYALPDSTWTFIGADTLFVDGLARRNGHPVLSFRDSEGEYQDRLAAEGKVVVFSVYNPGKASWERVQKQYYQVIEAGGTPLLLVASHPLEIDSYDIPIDMAVYYADYKTLITLNRSNGGASYFCEGELIEKWDQRGFPASLGWHLAADPVERSSHFILNRRLKAQGFSLYLTALLLLL
ncbi:MAG: DoxX family protein [Bacteroidales bacterium]|nr:DoxX family protein [Bacteroidales bacterium]